MAIAGGALVAGLVLAAVGGRGNPLAATWNAVTAMAAYEFSGVSSVSVGERRVHYLVEGEGGTAGRMRVTAASSRWRGAGPGPTARTGDGLEAEGGGLGEREGAAATAGATWHLRWPDVRDGAGRSVEPRAVAAVLPLGDPLALLAVAHGARSGALERVDGALCRRVDFLVAGRAYQRWWEDHRAFVPFNADAGGMTVFSAEGVVWVHPESGLPCRVRALASLPRTPGEGRGVAEVDWWYGGWR